MATQQQQPQQRPAQQPAAKDRTTEQVEQILSATSQKIKEVGGLLRNDDRIAQIRKLLPPQLKSQAERLVERAIMTLNRKRDEYAKATSASFVRAVCDAAELGLAIDGRLAHAVVYKNKIKGKDGEADRYVHEAQLVVDYKGCVAVARRCKLIVDCNAHLVYANEHFEIGIERGKPFLNHKPAMDTKKRGDLIGAFAIVYLPGGHWRYEWMTNEEINAIRARSKSWQFGGGPWKTDDGEMRKKTVIHRIMKLYQEDSGIGRMLELDARDFEDLPPNEPIEGTDESRNRYSPDPAGDDLEPGLAEGEIDPNDGNEP